MRLIDADALKKRMVNEPVKAVKDVDFQAEWFTRIADTVCHMIDMVDDAPTIDAVPVVHGKWVWLSSTYDRTPCEMRYRCSVCGHEEITHYGTEPWHNYCPNCGARMDGERREG